MISFGKGLLTADLDESDTFIDDPTCEDANNIAESISLWQEYEQMIVDRDKYPTAFRLLEEYMFKNAYNHPLAQLISLQTVSPAVSTLKSCRVDIPVKEFPRYNFVGRLLGPNGETMKSIEQMTGCKIQIRGEGSIPAHREHELRGKEGWEHLNDVLHVYIETCGKEPLASLALERGKRMIQEMLVPVTIMDPIKQQQLRRLASQRRTRQRMESDNQAKRRREDYIH